MWEYLKSLPSILSFALALIIILSIVIISLKGKLAAKVGKNEIDLGGGYMGDVPQDTQALFMPPKTGIFHKRSCGDCVLILMSERERYEIESKKIVNKVLKTQMNFFEQKLTEIQSLLIDDFCDKLGAIPGASDDDKQIQYKLFYGLMRDLLISVKDEIRRAYKENGFAELSDIEFSSYVKDKVKKIVSIATQHYQNLYPIKGTLLSTAVILGLIETNTPDIQQILFDSFAYAKEAVIESDKEADRIKDNFSKWIDNFIK